MAELKRDRKIHQEQVVLLGRIKVPGRPLGVLHTGHVVFESSPHPWYVHLTHQGALHAGRTGFELIGLFESDRHSIFEVWAEPLFWEDNLA